MTTSNKRPFTASQEMVASRIVELSHISYYDVLDVDSNANINEISRAYKKQALKLHPDKNSAPSAESAMRSVNLASEVLSDPIKREWYDFHGSSVRSEVSSPTTQTNMYSGEIPSDHSDVIDSQFKQFINTARGSNKLEEEANHEKRHFWIISIALTLFCTTILLLGFDPLMGSTQKQQLFSFQRNHFSKGRQHWTHGPRVPFYTDMNFKESDYPLDSTVRKRIEATVEKQHRENILKTCVHDRIEMEKKGGIDPVPSCVILEALYAE